MKKKLMLLILGILLISMFSVAVSAKSTVSEKLGKGFTTITEVIETVLSWAFKAITRDPDVWLRLLFFIAVFALLFKILQIIDPHGKMFDRKTAGIIGFVLSFGAVAIMPRSWLGLTLTMYGGLIFIILMGIPIFYLLSLTKDKLLDRASGATSILLLILGWIAFLVLVSSFFAAAEEMEATQTWAGISKQAVTESFEWIQTLIYVVGAITLVILFVSFIARMTRAGGQALPAGARQIPRVSEKIAAGMESPWFSPFKGWFGGGANIGIYAETCEDINTHLEQVEENLTEDGKETAEQALANTLSLLDTLQTKASPNIKAAIAALEQAGVKSNEMTAVKKDGRYIDTLLSQAAKVIGKAQDKLEKDDFQKVNQNVDRCNAIITKVNKLITEIVALQAAQK